MFITNVSSAGFLIEISGVSFLMDPWFTGQGFLNGWAPLNHSTLTDFPKTIDFLWISHEHPDHFSPPSLQALSKHLKYLPKVIFQETIDNRVANWFIKNRFKVKILKNLQEIKIDELEFRLQKFGLYDSILQIRNKKECFTNLNDAIISSKRDLRACNRFAGERHHVMTSQYGIANAGYAISDKDGWEEAKNKKISFFMAQLKELHPHICIPAASSVHFCADDNLYMNDHRVHPSCFIKEKRIIKKGTQILLPLPSKRINSTDRKGIKKTNELFESYYESLLTDTKNLVMHYQEKCELDMLHESLEKLKKRIFKNNNIFILWFCHWLGFMKDLNFYLIDKKIFIRCSIWKGCFIPISCPRDYIAISTEALTKTYSSPYGSDALISSGRYDLRTCTLKSLSDHLSIVYINTAGLYFRIGILLSPKKLKTLGRAIFSYLTYYLERKL